MATPSRGRPVEIDRSHLSEVAVRLFDERGFDAVSAAEVAEAAHVSRRSLFRYFPTKADLVWDGFERSLQFLQQLLDESTERDPKRAAMRAIVETAERAPSLETTRTRLRIIDTHPELLAVGSGQLRNQAGILRAFLIGRGIDPLPARVIAIALTMAAFTGYLHWATATEEPHPGPTVRQALEALSEITG